MTGEHYVVYTYPEDASLHDMFTILKDICGKYFLHCKLLKTLHIFSFIYWLTIFKIKMIRQRAKSFTIWPGMTPPSTVFRKICAYNSVTWLYEKNSFRLAFNFITLSRTIQEMILIHICCSFVKMRQESAMPIFLKILNKSIFSILWILQKIATLEVSQNKVYSLEVVGGSGGRGRGWGAGGNI